MKTQKNKIEITKVNPDFWKLSDGVDKVYFEKKTDLLRLKREMKDQGFTTLKPFLKKTKNRYWKDWGIGAVNYLKGPPIDVEEWEEKYAQDYKPPEKKEPEPEKEKLKLVYSVYDLSEKQFEWFEKNGLLCEDLKSCWLSKDGILDIIYDSGHGPDLEEIPRKWWVGSRFKQTEIARFEEHWKENQENEVLWEA
jgi:hypothetical protein